MTKSSASVLVPVSLIDVLPFILLMGAIGALWTGKRVWLPTLLLAIGAGFISGALTSFAALWIGLLALASLVYDQSENLRHPWQRRIAKAVGLVGILLLSLELALHRLPGFQNLPVLSGAVLSPNSAPYDLWINFDETVAGLFLLGLTYHRLIRTRADWRTALTRAPAPLVLTIAATLALALLLGFVRWAPKLNWQFAIWAPINLLTTCVSEEAFFRGFIQTEMATALRAWRWGYIVAICSSALLFGVAHIAGGWSYTILATAAGAGYAIALYRTQRIEVSILTHFGVNATQFLLFTYPYWVKH